MIPGHLDHLSADDRAMVGAAIRAAVEGPYFPDWEFSTLMGLSRPEVAAVADSWPQPPTETEEALRTQMRAVNNALNNLSGYPHRREDDLRSRLGMDRADLRALFDRWKTDEVRAACGRARSD